MDTPLVYIASASALAPDMDAVQAELEAALARIESLRHQHPYEASGYAGTPRFLPYDRPPGDHAA